RLVRGDDHDVTVGDELSLGQGRQPAPRPRDRVQPGRDAGRAGRGQAGAGLAAPRHQGVVLDGHVRRAILHVCHRHRAGPWRQVLRDQAGDPVVRGRVECVVELLPADEVLVQSASESLQPPRRSHHGDGPRGRIHPLGPSRFMTDRWQGSDVPRGAAYDRRFEDLAAGGMDVHGEAELVDSYRPDAVLDAGCGTGRVAIELSRRGYLVVGIDVDPVMLEAAQAKAPELTWVQGDLTDPGLE